MLRRTVHTAVAAGLALGLLTGCSFQTVVKDVTGGHVDIGGNKVPADFPKQVPLYHGTIVFGASIGSGDTEVWNVTVKVSGASAYAMIEKQLTDAGFAGQFGTAPGGGGTGTFARGRYGVLVVVTDAGSNGWVANYSVSRAGEKSSTPAPTVTPGSTH
jgi:hypothetical protein